MFSVFAVLPEGLQKTMDVPVNGKIEFIRPLHFRGRAADSLLIVTVHAVVLVELISVWFSLAWQAKETMCVLDYDVASQSMVTRLTGSLSSSGNRPPTEIKVCHRLAV